MNLSSSVVLELKGLIIRKSLLSSFFCNWFVDFFFLLKKKKKESSIAKVKKSQQAAAATEKIEPSLL
jgi:hypothetical protein